MTTMSFFKNLYYFTIFFDFLKLSSCLYIFLMAEERQISDPKTINYNKKVLIGNWFEETQNYKKTCHKRTTEYSREYVPKPVTWSLRYYTENTRLFPERHSDDTPNFFENYASLNDLSYNHIPKLSAQGNGDPKSLECINSFGNVTNYGIGDRKRQLWACEEYSKPFSIYGLYYSPPEPEDYLFPRWGKPRAVKGENGPIYLPLPEDHPRLAKCNPLTWECKKKTCRPGRK